MTPDSPAESPPPSDELLARYLSGECTPAECARIERWMAADPANDALVRRMRVAWAVPREGLATWDTERVRERLTDRLEAARTPVTPLRPANASRPISATRPARLAIPAAAIAAVILLAVALGVRPSRNGVSAQGSESLAPDAPRFSTRPGQRATVTLTDGSIVTLAAHSNLSLAQGFGAGRRTVVLEGEAFFEVATDSAVPFVVVVRGIETRALGTAFAIHGRDSTVTVAVVSGRVGIGAGPSARVLVPGDVGQAGVDGTTSMRHDPDAVATLTAWKDGWLTFDRLSAEAAAAAIGRWYDLDVNVPDPRLKARRISASFHNESAATVLRSVADVLDARIERSGRTVTIHPR